MNAWEIKFNLINKIGNWIISHGNIISKNENSNEFTGVCIYEIEWKNRTFRIVNVDGMNCVIECLK